MKRRILSLFLLGILFLFVLAACGQSQEDVVGKLTKKLDHLQGYTTKAVMTFKHGGKEQKYNAEIWYKKPNLYKVVLKDQNSENTQMIIKNKDGVFVLTPALNKKYHFQSEWPTNRSQYYLYQSLAKDIINDANAKFATKDDTYIFTTKANYPTKMLAHQKITLSKKNLAPVNVKIMDQDMNVIIDVAFNNFKFNPNFDSDAFDVQKNMTSMKFDVETMAIPDKQFRLYKPTITLPDTSLEYSKDITDNGERKFVLKYKGDNGFTLVETKSNVAASSSAVTLKANLTNLGFTFGLATDHTLSWSHDGMDFYLASNSLTPDEMENVARSVVGMVTK